MNEGLRQTVNMNVTIVRRHGASSTNVHGGAPYDNLYTDILLTKGGDGFHLSGGNRSDEGNSGVRDTYWNLRKLAGTFSGIKGPDRHPQMNIVGVKGLTTVRPSNDSLDVWIESWPGEQTRPANLYLAQRERRANHE